MHRLNDIIAIIFHVSSAMSLSSIMIIIVIATIIAIACLALQSQQPRKKSNPNIVDRDRGEKRVRI